MISTQHHLIYKGEKVCVWKWESESEGERVGVFVSLRLWVSVSQSLSLSVSQSLSLSTSQSLSLSVSLWAWGRLTCDSRPAGRCSSLHWQWRHVRESGACLTRKTCQLFSEEKIGLSRIHPASQSAIATSSTSIPQEGGRRSEEVVNKLFRQGSPTGSDDLKIEQRLSVCPCLSQLNQKKAWPVFHD